MRKEKHLDCLEGQRSDFSVFEGGVREDMSCTIRKEGILLMFKLKECGRGMEEGHI